jgi:aminopeptidase
MVFTPEKKILEKYADLLVNFALNDGKGIKKGEVVYLQVPECAKPILIELRNTILKAGGIPLINYMPDEMAREFYELASDEQLDFFPGKYLRGRVDQMDHAVFIEADVNPKELEGIDGKKIMRRGKVFKPYFEWRDEKENAGKFTWTLGLYGTEAMAREAGMTLEEYWEQIIKACYLDEQDPKEKWSGIFLEVERVKNKLNSLKIEKIKVRGVGIDLTVGLGNDRQWMGGSGRNIPSYEVFISPDWRKTEGRIRFNQPLYRYGNLIKNVSLEFKSGRVVTAGAVEGEEILKEMIATENADKIGEFSLTDCRLSRVGKFMATTLFDENAGGIYGNTHIALGNAYQDSYPGDASKISKEEWAKMGYNNSSVHTDIVSTENREVYATLEDGREILIYIDGKFVI